MDAATARLVLEWQIEDARAIETALLIRSTDMNSNSPEEARRRVQTLEDELMALNLGEEIEESLSDEPTEECTSCTADFLQKELYTAPCEHLYCRTCLTTLFEMSMNDLNRYPPTCCKEEIPFDPKTQLHLLPATAAAFEAKIPELKSTNRTYCHQPSCNVFINVNIPDAVTGEDSVKCPACGEETCTICKGAVHEGDCPQDESTRMLRETAKDEGWQTCYRCKRVIELDIGCNHITCTCGAEFCYQCGAEWKTCNCDHANEENLIADEDEDHDRAARIVAELLVPGRLPIPDAAALMRLNDAGRFQEALDEFDRQIHLRDQPQLALVNGIPQLIRQEPIRQEPAQPEEQPQPCTHAHFRRINGPHECTICHQRMHGFIFQCRGCLQRVCLNCKNHRLQRVEPVANGRGQREGNWGQGRSRARQERARGDKLKRDARRERAGIERENRMRAEAEFDPTIEDEAW